MSVRNEAAPRVWFMTPSDGDRLAAGQETSVRVMSEGAEELTVTVEDGPEWTARAATLTERWTPAEGRHRIVAVASAPGRPDGVAEIAVTGVAPAPAAGGGGDAGGAGAVGPQSPAYLPGTASDPAASLVAPVASGRAPAQPGASATGPGGAGGGGGRAVAGAGPAGLGGAAAAAPGRGRDRRAGDEDAGGGWRAGITRFLTDPEKVAWGVGLPLLLIAAGVGYALLQRFIDGGQKLAWRGRGRPDDTIVEF